jgi:hypothetical protein
MKMTRPLRKNQQFVSLATVCLHAFHRKIYFTKGKVEITTSTVSLVTVWRVRAPLCDWTMKRPCTNEEDFITSPTSRLQKKLRVDKKELIKWIGTYSYTINLQT